MLRLRFVLYLPFYLLVAMWAWSGASSFASGLFLCGLAFLLTVVLEIGVTYERTEQTRWSFGFGSAKGVMLFGFLGLFAFVLALAAYGAVFAFPELRGSNSLQEIFEDRPDTSSGDRLRFLLACFVGGYVLCLIAMGLRAYLNWRREKKEIDQSIKNVTTI